MEMTLKMAHDVGRIVRFMQERESDVDFYYCDAKFFQDEPKGYSKLLVSALNEIESGVLQEDGPQICRTSKTDYFFKHNSLPDIIKSQIEKRQAEALHQKRLMDKTKIDLLIAKRMKNTYWITFTLAILGFAMALINLFFNLMK